MDMAGACSMPASHKLKPTIGIEQRLEEMDLSHQSDVKSRSEDMKMEATTDSQKDLFKKEDESSSDEEDDDEEKVVKLRAPNELLMEVSVFLSIT